jgi:phosphoglycerol transferase MdoB-like AlkP superfamily enzyme
MRGSLGTFPLQKEDITISESEFINDCVPNGLFLLNYAYADTKKEFKIDPPDQVLKKYGYKSIEHAFANYKNISIDSLKNQSLEELMYITTSKSQSNKKYNVVFLLMESMSTHLINLHTKNCNLLGALEPHFMEDVVFKNFQSSGNGTITSLENIILNVPFHPIFETKYRFQSFDLSIAKPFKDVGYSTNFVTGIELGWRNLDKTLKRQYFNHVIGKSAILKNDSKAKANDTWGVYDHCVLGYIFDRLILSDSAMFIMSLSSTNHTPYELPEEYEPLPIDPNIVNNPEFSTRKERIMPILTAFQYSNDALGQFMDKIKHSELAENTIVIITGDHNMRSTLHYNTQELMKLKFSVPLYLYIPEDLKKELYFDTERWGSHYDIMTSILPYILNNVKYPDLGQDLFSKDISSDEYYSINDAQLLCNDSANVEIIRKKIKARQAILKYYYSGKILNK